MKKNNSLENKLKFVVESSRDVLKVWKWKKYCRFVIEIPSILVTLEVCLLRQAKSR